MDIKSVFSKNMKKYMDTHDQSSIPEYAKTGLDMANFFGAKQNNEKFDYSNFFSRFFKNYY